jgi:hypothetical protein
MCYDIPYVLAYFLFAEVQTISHKGIHSGHLGSIRKSTVSPTIAE